MAHSYHFWDVNSDGDLAVDPKRINHFEVHFDVRFEQVSGLPSSCALGAFGLRKPYRDVFRCELWSPVTVAVFLRFVWMLVLWVSRLVVRPDVEKGSKQTEIGHGPVASKTQHSVERHAITAVVSRFIWMLISV